MAISFAWCASPTTSAANDETQQAPAEGGSSSGDGGVAETVYRGWMEAKPGAGGRGGAEVYPADDLDLLALYFTVVKVRKMNIKRG